MLAAMDPARTSGLARFSLAHVRSKIVHDREDEMPKGYFLSEVDVANPGAYVIAERRQTDTGVLMLLNTSTS
jgi:hypothetical protein